MNSERYCDKGHLMRHTGPRDAEWPDGTSGWHWETWHCDICDQTYEEDVDDDPSEEGDYVPTE